MKKIIESFVKLPTAASRLQQGKVVDLDDLLAEQQTVIFEPRPLCASHVRGLASSISEQGMVCPLMLGIQGDAYVLVDGYHRLAAIEMLRKTHPNQNHRVLVVMKGGAA